MSKPTRRGGGAGMVRRTTTESTRDSGPLSNSLTLDASLRSSRRAANHRFGIPLDHGQPNRETSAKGKQSGSKES